MDKDGRKDNRNPPQVFQLPGRPGDLLRQNEFSWAQRREGDMPGGTMEDKANEKNR